MKDKTRNAILMTAQKETNETRIKNEKMTYEYSNFIENGGENTGEADAEDELLGHINYSARMEESFRKMIIYDIANDNLHFFQEYAKFLEQKNNAQNCAEDFTEAIEINTQRF